MADDKKFTTTITMDTNDLLDLLEGFDLTAPAVQQKLKGDKRKNFLKVLAEFKKQVIEGAEPDSIKQYQLAKLEKLTGEDDKKEKTLTPEVNPQ